MKRLLVMMLAFLFLLSGCGILNSTSGNGQRVSDENVQPTDGQQGESAVPAEEEKMAEEEAKPEEPPKDVELLEDDSSVKPDEKEAEAEKEKAKEAEKKPMPYRLQIDVTNQVVTAFARDSKGKYTKVVRRMICSTGTSTTPTPLGTFVMPGQKGRWGYFTKFDVYAQYWSRIRGGILFHSVIFKKADESTLSVGSFNNLGRPASHGCIRLQVADAKWIYDHVAGGTEVVVTKAKKNSALTASLKPQPILPHPVKIAIGVENVLDLKVGASVKLTAKVTYDNGTVKTNPSDITWKVDNTKIASVQSGTVKGLTAGAVSVFAVYDQVTSNKVAVTVSKVKAVKVAIAPADPVEIKAGEQKTVVAKVTYDNNTTVDNPSGLTWVSDNGTIATVTGGVIKGIKTGTTAVSVSYSGPNGEKLTSGKVNVTVLGEEDKGTLTISPSDASFSIEIGKTKTLAAKIDYTAKDDVFVTTKSAWSSSDEAIAKVNVTETGAVVTGVAKGEVTITVKYGDYAAVTRKVVVTEAAVQPPAGGEGDTTPGE